MVVMGIAFMALLSVFLLWVWIVSMVLGLVDHQDLRRDPRYACSSDGSEQKIEVQNCDEKPL